MTEEKTGKPPQVSVLIAAWSAEATLDRAIDSALAQTVPVQVIVIDDASPDTTARIAEARAAGDRRVHLIRQTENQGPSAARNLGLDRARAPWITILDSDDFFCEPDRFERLLTLAGTEGADFVADDLWKVYEADPYGARTRMISDTMLGVRTLSAAEFVSANLSSRRGGRREYGFLKPIISRDFLTRHGLRYDPAIRLGEDYVLYAKALIAGGKFVLTDAAGYAAVVREGSLAGSHPTEAHQHLVAADRALIAASGADAETRAALRAHMIEQHKKWAWRKMIDAKRGADLGAALRCFWAPPAVIADLIARLWAEVTSRSMRRQGTR